MSNEHVNMKKKIAKIYVPTVKNWHFNNIFSLCRLFSLYTIWDTWFKNLHHNILNIRHCCIIMQKASNQAQINSMLHYCICNFFLQPFSFVHSNCYHQFFISHTKLLCNIQTKNIHINSSVYGFLNRKNC